MEYKPGKIKKNHNVSQTSPTREFAVLVSGISAFVVVIYLLLGMAVDRIVDSLPEDWANISYNTFSDADVDWETSEPLQRMIDELAVCAAIEFPIKLNISNAEQVNAFALPNGQIVVFSGLLDALKTENGLAFVLAHELSHFKNRDHLRQMGRGVVLSALFALITGDSTGLSEALTPAMLAGNASYSQEREMEADNRALEILHCHYGHVAGATELFEFYRDKPSNVFDNSFLSSHPDPEERINNIADIIKKHSLEKRSVKALQL